MDILLCVIGLVLIVEGIPYFAFPDKIKGMMRIALEQPDGILRIFGGLMMLLGLIIVFVVKRSSAFTEF
jgi:hypothetical protein